MFCNSESIELGLKKIRSVKNFFLFKSYDRSRAEPEAFVEARIESIEELAQILFDKIDFVELTSFIQRLDDILPQMRSINDKYLYYDHMLSVIDDALSQISAVKLL